MKTSNVKQIENAPYNQKGKGVMYVLASDFLAFAKEAEEEFSNYVQECNLLHAKDNEKILALQSRLDEAVNMLEKYGDHIGPCPGDTDCECGLLIAISKAKAVKG